MSTNASNTCAGIRPDAGRVHVLERLALPGPVHLVVDSTGLSVMGEGEWAAAKYGGRGKRGWKKLHLGVDQPAVIVTQALTGPTEDDATTGVALVRQTHGDVASVTADAAYDTGSRP